MENKWQVHIQIQQVQWAVNHQGAEQTQLLNPSVGKAPSLPADVLWGSLRDKEPQRTSAGETRKHKVIGKWLEYKKDGFQENTEKLFD